MIAGTKHEVSKMTGAFDGYGDGGEGVWGAVEAALRRCGLSARVYLRACLRMLPEPLPTCGRCSASLIRGAGNHRVILYYHQRRRIGQHTASSSDIPATIRRLAETWCGCMCTSSRQPGPVISEESHLRQAGGSFPPQSSSHRPMTPSSRFRN